MLFASYSLWAQKEKAADERAAALFEQYYNQGHYDSIFKLFSAEMQTALSLDKTNEFLAGLKDQAGKIKARTFSRYENETYASYKVQFERALLAVNISTDGESRINGLLVKPFTDKKLPTPERNTTRLQLPFKGEWTVIWGGDTREQNYHVESEAQKNAFDLVITAADGNSYKSDGKTNEDYYAFGQPLSAPCDAKVVLVVDGIKDNVPGILNPVYVPGNTVILETAAGEYLFFAHFKKHSIKVKEGQSVKTGDLLGLCGNSGNSSEPHLHFHIQNTENMTEATGIKCFFDKLKVNGQYRSDYSPVQKDKIGS